MPSLAKATRDAERSDAARWGARSGVVAGRWLVGLIGFGIVVIGAVLATQGFRRDLSDSLRLPRGRLRTAVERIGTAGMTGRGLVYALVGAFLVDAAVSFDPGKAKGLDASLKVLAHQPYGTVLIWVAVVALLAFALWSFLEARFSRL